MHKGSEDFEVKIEKMNEKDLLSLLKIGKAHWEKDKWLTMDYLKSSFNQAGLSFVAKIDKETIGGIILVYEDIVKNWIRYLIVDKKFRRQGIGKLLMQKILSKIKKGKNVFVDAWIADENAIGFYKSMGFKNMGTVKKLYDGKYGACFLEKKV